MCSRRNEKYRGNEKSVRGRQGEKILSRIQFYCERIIVCTSFTKAVNKTTFLFLVSLCKCAIVARMLMVSTIH